MDQVYFVSDIHLKRVDEPNAQVFLNFLKSLGRDRKVTHLFLVGDVFDFWLGDHQYFQKKFSIFVEQIQRLIDEQVQVHYFEGNHDLYLTKFWQEQVGATVHVQAQYFTLANRRVRIEHGDLIDPDDRGYLFLKRVLQSSAMRFIGMNLSYAMVARVGEKASQLSRQYTSESKVISEEETLRKIRKHAVQACVQRPFDLLVAGHLHVRDEHKWTHLNGEATSINLGTWLKQPVALYLCAEGWQFLVL